MAPCPVARIPGISTPSQFNASAKGTFDMQVAGDPCATVVWKAVLPNQAYRAPCFILLVNYTPSRCFVLHADGHEHRQASPQTRPGVVASAAFPRTARAYPILRLVERTDFR